MLRDGGFPAAAGDPKNRKIRPKGEGNVRMMVETVRSMLTVVCHFEPLRHWLWPCVQAHLAAAMAVFNRLVAGHGLKPDDAGRLPLSIAAFSL